jgi:hypothetical protein
MRHASRAHEGLSPLTARQPTVHPGPHGAKADDDALRVRRRTGVPLHVRFIVGGMEVSRMALLFTMFLSGVLLYLIGSAMDRHERAEREKRWRK